MTITDKPQNPKRRLPLSTLAQFAEIVASVAVLITLVFLVVGVRQNTEITRSAAYDRSMAGLNEWRLAIATDPELAAIFETYVQKDPASQGPTDFRLGLILNALWGVYENAYYAHERRILDDAEWSRFEIQICISYGRESYRWATTPGIRLFLTENFASYTESLCED